MKIKLDENIPPDVLDLLSKAGHDVATVQSEGLVGRPDSVVADAAKQEGRVLFTLDVRIADIRLGREYGPLRVPGPRSRPRPGKRTHSPHRYGAHSALATLALSTGPSSKGPKSPRVIGR